MRRLVWSFGRAVLGAVLLTLVASCSSDARYASSDGREEWRFAIEEIEGSVQHAYAMKFKELIEERTGGEVAVTVYPYGALGTSDQLTEQLDLGIVQFVMASPGHLGKLIPEVQVFLLHFVLSDDEQVNYRVLSEDPALRRRFDALFADKGMKLLAVFSEGWQVWTTKKPIREPADFRGVRMRVMTSPLLLAAYNAYGASATPYPYSEVYTGLQLNALDGQENPVFAIQEMSFYEVTDWMIFPKHAPFIATAVSNRDFFDSLSPQRQQVVREVIAELDEYILERQQEYNAKRLDLIRAKRPDLNIIEELTDEEREQFRQASLPVRDRFIKMAGPDGETILNELLEAVARTEATHEAAPE
jgi:tripartite ATP-independent transporter DctP family solute receptor